APSTQYAPSPHATAHPPQWAGSDDRLVHAPAQSSAGGGHAFMHAPPTHISSESHHWSHAPQCEALVRRSTQLEPHRVSLHASGPFPPWAGRSSTDRATSRSA